MDIADSADRQVEQFLQRAVAQKQPEGPKYTGYCANCGDAVEAPRRWCDRECMDQEQKRSRRMYGENK